MKLEIGATVSLDSEQRKHVQTVLRLRAGDAVTVIDPVAHSEWRAQIVVVGKESFLEILDFVGAGTTPAVMQHLIQALAKGDRNDLICEKATELGVERITFFQAERSVVRLRTERDFAERQARFSRIAESGAAQSGKRYLPTVDVHRDLSSVLRTLPDLAESRRLVASLEPGSLPAKSHFPLNRPAALVIGPEGDLTPEEYALLAKNDFQPLSLGPYVLRTETAAIAGIAAIQAVAD